MKSIRLSLIVYFLALIALALGGVSALSYQTASQTLQDKQASTENLIRTQFDAQCQQARAVLDNRLLRQAQRLASKVRFVPMPSQTLSVYLSIAVGAGSNPVSRITAPLWIAPLAVQPVPPGDFRPNLAIWMSFQLRESVRLVELQIPATAVDAVMPLPMDEEHHLEVFQTYRKNGVPAQRSESLKDHWLTLSDAARASAEEIHEEYDDIELDGRKLRRVTLKTKIEFFFGGPYRKPGGKGQFNAKKAPAPPKQPGSGPTPFSTPFFIQYASDTANLGEQIREFAATRDARLAHSAEETQSALLHVRRRLLWISALTFVGIIVGGYLVLRLGLAPLARLSDAVSKVSERNFELQVEAHKLPSELRPIAHRLRQSLEQLSQAFKREKQAAADISHELRTPLAALMTTLDVALRKHRSPEEYRDILAECRISGAHMSHLVERLMALARLDAGVERPSLEAVDVGELAQQCADMVHPLAQEQGLTLTACLAEPIVTLTDARKLREIVLNLLHNAIAYNKPRGSIEMTVGRDNGQVLLAVRDTGIGITPEAQTHLFERFFRADPSRHADTPHCGLGLAIVKSYVELLQGSIHVDSSPAGSSFEIRLPYRAGEPATATIHETLMQTAIQ